MRRVKPKEETKGIVVDAIVFSDTHCGPTAPTCRVDADWARAQEKKFDAILDWAMVFDCPNLFHAGDFWNRWDCPLWFVNHLIRYFQGHTNQNFKIYGIPGQHDLPQHKMDRLGRSAWETLVLAGVIAPIVNSSYLFYSKGGLPVEVVGFPWGASDYEDKWQSKTAERRVAVVHKLVRQDREPLFPGDVSPTARAILKAIPNADLIVTGDNHQSFVYEEKGRLLVNPGSMMRRTIAQEDHQPSVYFWNAEHNEVERKYLTIDKNMVVVDRQKAEQEEARKDRVNVFVKRLVDSDIEIEAHFQRNLEAFMKKAKTPKRVTELVWDIVERG